MNISRRTFFILIGILVILLIIIIGWFVFRKTTIPLDGTQTTIRDFFPFGKPTTTPNDGTKPTKPTPKPDTGETPTQTKTPRLRKVWAYAVAGYTLIDKDIPTDPLALPKDEVITITPTYTFVKTLSKGSKDVEVKELETLLNQCPETLVAEKGVGSKGKEGTTFTENTKKALMKFQEKFPDEILVPLNRTTGSGTLDTLTRKVINQPFSCTLHAQPPETVKKAVARFVEKKSGNVYDVLADSLESKRLTNTTIPHIAEAFFVNDAANVLLRYLRDDNRTIETFLGKLPTEKWGADAEPLDLKGVFMSQNILDISVSPDTKRIFTLSPFAGGVLGVTSSPDGSNSTQVFSSPFFGWLSAWPTNKDIILTTKASGYAAGYAFKIDSEKKVATPEKEIGNVAGLTTLPSPKMDFILFSRNTANGPRIALFNTKTNKMRELDFGTLPEKCFWRNDGLLLYCGIPSLINGTQTMPDSWYQGIVSFTDTIVEIDPTGLFPDKTLVEPTAEVGERIDAIKLSLSPDQKYLYFVNKRDDILWQLLLR